jgi:dienelactone hydrolase
MIRFWGMALLLATLGEPAAADTAFDPVPLSIPVTDGNGDRFQMSGLLCLPQGATRPRVVLLNHGAFDGAPRPDMIDCKNEQAQWFLARGYAVSLMLRRGYGTSNRKPEAPPCGRRQDAVLRGGLEGARDLEAAVAYLASLPQVRADGMVVQGHSAGGWATIALGTLKDSRVAGLMNFAGGRTCSEDVSDVVAAAAAFGSVSGAVPMLWVYAANDYWWPGETRATALYAGYAKGGGKADFHILPTYGSDRMDAHNFWYQPGASAIWGPIVEAYLKQRGVMGADGKASP